MRDIHFRLEPGKGFIVKIYWRNGALYFGIDRKNIIYHRFFENLKEDANKILSQPHPPENRSDSNEAD